MEKPEALFLADELEAPLGTVIGAELYRRAAKELRWLHASCEDYAQHKQRQDKRVLELKAQRDALLEALKRVLDRFDPYTVPGYETNVAAEEKARAAIAAVEGEKS